MLVFRQLLYYANLMNVFFQVITKYCVFNYVDNSILDPRNDKHFNTMAGYANRTFGFLMRDIGTITGGWNGLQGAGMAYTSVNGSSFYKTNLELTHLKNTKRIQNTHRPVLNLSIAKIVLLLLLSVILVTIRRWLRKCFP